MFPFIWLSGKGETLGQKADERFPGTRGKRRGKT